jgi:ketosteroid isomerase-like protein
LKKTSDLPVREIAEKLVALCTERRFVEAVRTLYADDVECRENTAAPTRGLAAALENNEVWVADHDVQRFDIPNYYVDNDTIVVEMVSDFASKESGKHFHTEEIGVYKVRNGMIVSARFYYGTS